MKWMKKYQAHSWSIQDDLMNRTIKMMEIMMLGMLEKISTEYLETGSYTKPSDQQMYLVMERFYSQVVHKAYGVSQVVKQVQGFKPQSDKKKLGKLPLGIPNRLPPLVKFFSSKRMWPTMQRRGRIIVGKLQKAYFKKLDRKFAEIGPALQRGEISPEEVKKELREAWKATKSRVETIFQTETTNYFNKVQVSFFNDDEDIIGFLFQSNRDSSTTDICRKRDGLIYRPGTQLLKENTPACHWRCRSELIPLANTPQNLKMFKDTNRDPNKRRVPPLPPGWVAGRK
jgi:SPP1 gp7 family putative phage head morphogenesis protein